MGCHSCDYIMLYGKDKGMSFPWLPYVIQDFAFLKGQMVEIYESHIFKETNCANMLRECGNRLFPIQASKWECS